MGIVIAIFGLGLMIFFHELGHLLMARWVGIPVVRFSIGMGPVVWKRDVMGIEWALSAFPFGGYVMFDGESAAYEQAAPWRKMATALAGPAANFLVAIVLYILAISIKTGTFAVTGGLDATLSATGQLLKTLTMLFSGQVGTKDLGGPVMMVSAGASLAHNPSAFLQYLGIISLNLGIFNLLPVPALDGGQIILLIVQSFSGRTLSERFQNVVVGGSFALLLGLILWVTLQDVVRLL